MATVRIALANISYADNPEDSIVRAVRAIEEASAAHAAIICFPECYVPGYRAADWPVPVSDNAFLDRAWATIAKAAGEHRIAVVLGTERIVNGAPLITALVINADGTIAGFQDKGQIDPSEDGLYIAGDGQRTCFKPGP